MRNFPALIFILATAIMFGLALYFYGGATFQFPIINTTPTAKTLGQLSPVPFLVLEEGNNAPAVSVRVNYSIKNVDELSSLWELVYGSNGPTVPTIDFTKYVVLAIFDGSHSTSGYGITVQSIEDRGGKRMVMITRTTPGEGCPTTNTISAPFQIVRIQKTPLTLDHEDTVVQGTSCAQ